MLTNYCSVRRIKHCHCAVIGKKKKKGFIYIMFSIHASLSSFYLFIFFTFNNFILAEVLQLVSVCSVQPLCLLSTKLLSALSSSLPSDPISSA